MVELQGLSTFSKTIVFCVDQEHADEMGRMLSNLNADIVARGGQALAAAGAEPVEG